MPTLPGLTPVLTARVLLSHHSQDTESFLRPRRYLACWGAHCCVSMARFTGKRTQLVPVARTCSVRLRASCAWASSPALAASSLLSFSSWSLCSSI